MNKNKLNKLMIFSLLGCHLIMGNASATTNPSEETITQNLVGCWEKSIRTLGFRTLKYDFEPTPHELYYQLKSTFTFYNSGQEPNTRSTLVKVENNQISFYKFNTMEVIDSDFFEVKGNQLFIYESNKQNRFTMTRCPG